MKLKSGMILKDCNAREVSSITLHQTHICLFLLFLFFFLTEVTESIKISPHLYQYSTVNALNEELMD